MFKKMRAGELSLGVTLWKYGVLYVSLLTFVVKVFERLLYRQTRDLDIVTYYTKVFNLSNPDTMAILWTLCYATIILVWIFYVLNVFAGIWRSSGADKKSSWLRGIVRVFAIVLTAIAALIVFG